MASAKAKDVDEYIASAPEPTRPILVKLRRIFRQASPKLEEAIKWGVPCYVYKGMVGGFAAYTKHVSWGLWKARLLNDPDGIIGRGIMAGGKITTVSEIPRASKLIRLIKQVIALNEAGVKAPRKTRSSSISRGGRGTRSASRPREQEPSMPFCESSRPRGSRWHAWCCHRGWS